MRGWSCQRDRYCSGINRCAHAAWTNSSPSRSNATCQAATDPSTDMAMPVCWVDLGVICTVIVCSKKPNYPAVVSIHQPASVPQHRPDRVGDAQEDDWNCRSRASGSESGGRRKSNNDIDVAVQNLGDEAGFLCERALRPAYVNGQVLPFGPAALLERFAKGCRFENSIRRRDCGKRIRT